MNSSSSDRPESPKSETPADDLRPERAPPEPKALVQSSTAELTPSPDLEVPGAVIASPGEEGMQSESPAAASNSEEAPEVQNEATSAEPRRRRIKIGSERDQAAAAAPQRVRSKPLRKHRAKPPADASDAKEPIASESPASRQARPVISDSPGVSEAQVDTDAPTPIDSDAPTPIETELPAPISSVSDEPSTATSRRDTSVSGESPAAPPIAAPLDSAPPGVMRTPPVEDSPPRRTGPAPKIDRTMPADLERQLEAEIEGVSIDALVDSSAKGTAVEQELEPTSKHKGRVVSVHHENVFVELPAQHQGLLALKQFTEPPEVGSEIEVVVRRFDAEEGLYELSRPGVAVQVGDWSALSEGLMLEVVISGHNKGGLECQIHGIRGFIPASHIDLYRVEELETFVGKRFNCLVTEVNPRRRKLVLSRRAVLEREKAEAKARLMEELAPGQIREGVVRSLQEFGAFIDLGGVDGLLHVSQMSWSRIKHPNEVLEMGQTLQTKVLKVDKTSGKVSLGLKDLIENPWTLAESNYPAKSEVQGKVTRLTDYGAFVELEPGVEGLVHISELAHRRVGRVSEIVSEGHEVDAQVLSVDPKARRIALSIKALAPPPEKPESRKKSGTSSEAKPRPKRKPVDPNLRGGLGGGGSEGDKFGLRW